MAAGYGFSHVHEPQPRKKVWNRVTPQVKRPVGRPRSRYTTGQPDPDLSALTDGQLLRKAMVQAIRQDMDDFIDKAVSSTRKGKTNG
jgi:hypothetical protein